MTDKIQIFTDGACSGNPGPGGFGVIIKTPVGGGVLSYEHSFGYRWTTNNRMELLAVIFGLEQVKDGTTVEVTSDSKYVVNAINDGWLERWRKSGWKTAGNKPVKNVDLWKRYIEAANGKHVSFIWVKGHDENKDNERCDELAVSAYQDHNGHDLLEDGQYLLQYGT